MSHPPKTVRSAVRHLRLVDPRLADVILRVGPCQMKLHRNRFAALARAIVAQQISGAAARTIWSRLQDSLRPETVSAETLSRRTADDLRLLGLSRQKARYLGDLAEKTGSGAIRLKRLSKKTDEEIIQQLTLVDGIGRWTAQMFLIFSLGRLDVFAPDDLGLRTAIRRIYELEELPNKASCLRFAEPWRPYSSIASWYLWRSLDK